MKPRSPKKRDVKPNCKTGEVKFTGGTIQVGWYNYGCFDYYAKKILEEFEKPKEGLEVVCFMKYSDVKELVRGSMFLHSGLPVILESWETHPEYNTKETTRVKLIFNK